MTASAFVISLTPFDRDGRLDENGLRLHYRRLSGAGIGVYVVGGGSGEAYALSDAEVLRIMEIAKEELLGKVPVRAMGKEPRTASELVSFARMVKDVGLEAMQVYSLDAGHGLKPLPEEIERYFSDILSEVDVPAVISTHQSVGYQIPLVVLERLITRFPRVIGINCTHPDISYLVQVCDLAASRGLEVHVGGTQQALACLCLGGTGWLTSEGNLAPKLCIEVTDCWNAGDFAGAQAAFGRVLHLYAANSRFGSIRGIKAALEILGLPGGAPRPPRLPLSLERRTEIERLIEENDIRRIEGFS